MRDYAKHYGEMYVITGSVLQALIQWLPSGRVAIPSRFYKIMLRTSPARMPEVLAIILPHIPFQPGPGSGQGKQRSTSADAYLAGHLVSISEGFRIRHEVEAFENLNLLPAARSEAIPEAVRMFVWQRDEGKCVKCGSREKLEFDHIIPVADSGSSTERNVQLLCETCNRRKGRSVS